MLARSGLVAIIVVLWAGSGWAAGTEVSSLDAHPSYRKAVALIKAGDCKGAIPVLESVQKERGGEADVLNWLGYCHRQTKSWAQARTFYDQALKIEPKHKGANEYLGELLAEQGDLKGARERLEVLKGVCGTACPEYKDLNAAIEKAGTKK